MTVDLKTILSTIGENVDRRAATLAAPPDDVLPPLPVPDVEDRIPAAYRWARTSSPELAALLDRDPAVAVRQLLACPRAVITGPAGAGKTALAIALFRDRLEARQRAVFMPSFRLALARSTSPLGEEALLVRQALVTPLLVLDELGSEPALATSAVCEVLYERHLENRFTLVTTPFTEAEIAARYGGGIARRVFEGARMRLGARPAAAAGAPRRSGGSRGS